MTGAVYNAGHPYSTERNDRDAGEVARYAWSDDYHHVIGQRLESLLAWMRSIPSRSKPARTSTPVRYRSAFTRSTPGLGWIGKNSCVINPELGSWVLLGAIICSLPLEPDAPSLDQCGTCTLCLEACPTGGVRRTPRARCDRCVSY